MNLQLWVRPSMPLLLGALVLAITAWIYWPGISGPALLDDRASVTILDGLGENPNYAWDYIFGDIAGPLGRPVSMLTFVLEKLYLDEGIGGGKKVNIVLHLLNGCLVFWLLSLLLSYIGAPAHRWLALLAGSAWLLSPLYVSTVLYVVQRMAMLAAFFMLAGCISYVYWRLRVIAGKQGVVSLLLVFVFMVLAVYAKEPAIILVPVLLLMESLWFQFRGPGGQPVKWLRALTLGLIVAGAAFLGFIFVYDNGWLAGGFYLLDYTQEERLLTESRILWDYVGQLFIPDVTRMGLYHDDVVISRSLLQPVSTLYAVLSWLCVFVLSAVLLKWRWGRYLVFSLALFLVGHSTESTVLPLELYFEHRNYFPGIGLFLGLAICLGLLFKKWPELAVPLLVWGVFVVLALSAHTSSQVQVWSRTPLLYLSHINGHPESFRANADMATLMAEVGELNAALEYSARAHRFSSNERQGDYDIRDLALSCTVNQPLPPARIAALGTVDPRRPLSSVSTLNVLVRQLQDDQCPRFDRLLFADRMAAIFLDTSTSVDGAWKDQYEPKAAANIYAGLAVLENSLERYDKAYQYTQRFIIGSPGSVRGLLMKLHFATALQKEQEISVTLARLLALEDAGVLTLADQQTLSLYKEK